MEIEFKSGPLFLVFMVNFMLFICRSIVIKRREVGWKYEGVLVWKQGAIFHTLSNFTESFENALYWLMKRDNTSTFLVCLSLLQKSNHVQFYLQYSLAPV